MIGTMDNKPKLHLIDPVEAKTQVSIFPVIIVTIIALIAGIGTGYLIGSGKTPITSQESVSVEDKDLGISDEKPVQTAGIKNEKTFTDKAEGILQEGGIEGEGTFHLERPGGPSQTAYLTSTTVDLSPFIGKKIRVLGKTFQGKKAGWLMDVGYVEVLQ